MGTPAGETREWDVKLNMSTMANPADSTVDLEEAVEEMDMDRDVSLEEVTVMERDHD